MKKRFLSLFLALAFVFSLMASTALAVVKDDPAQPLYAACPQCRKGRIETKVWSYENEMLTCPKGGRHLVIHVTEFAYCASCGFNYGFSTHDVIDCDKCK